MTQQNELRTAAKTLHDACDDVSAQSEGWKELFAEDNRCELPEVNRFVSLFSPAVALAVADWLHEWAEIEFREDGPMTDDMAAALRIARAVNGGAA